jgi:hypothetical protein
MIKDIVPVLSMKMKNFNEKTMETNEDDVDSCDNKECVCDQDEECACEQDEKCDCDQDKECDCDTDEEGDCDTDEECDCDTDEECGCFNRDEGYGDESDVDAVAKIEPEVMALLEDYIDIKNIFRTDMGICCPPGKVCCPRCAYNLRFRGGSIYHVLGDRKLIDRVASGLKPVGMMGTWGKRCEIVRSKIIAAGLEILVDGVQNKMGCYLYYFARPDNANKMFSDFINLAAVEEITGNRLNDCRIRDHVVDPAFLNEFDSFLARGIVYGYPLWSSIAML